MRETYLNISDKLSRCRSSSGTEASRYESRSSRLLRATQKKRQKSISALFCIKETPHRFSTLRSEHHTSFFIVHWHVTRSVAPLPFAQHHQLAFFFRRLQPWLPAQHPLPKSCQRAAKEGKQDVLKGEERRRRKCSWVKVWTRAASWDNAGQATRVIRFHSMPGGGAVVPVFPLRGSEKRKWSERREILRYLQQERWQIRTDSRWCGNYLNKKITKRTVLPLGALRELNINTMKHFHCVVWRRILKTVLFLWWKAIVSSTKNHFTSTKLPTYSYLVCVMRILKW